MTVGSTITRHDEIAWRGDLATFTSRLVAEEAIPTAEEAGTTLLATAREDGYGVFTPARRVDLRAAASAS